MVFFSLRPYGLKKVIRIKQINRFPVPDISDMAQQKVLIEVWAVDILSVVMFGYQVVVSQAVLGVSSSRKPVLNDRCSRSHRLA